MTSGDNATDMSKLELLLREHFARTDKQIADMRAENAEFHTKLMKDISDFKTEVRKDMQDFKTEVRKDMQEFKSEIRQDMKEFKSEIRQDMSSFKSEIKQDISSLRADVIQIQRDVEGLKHDVIGLCHWDYWILSIILVLFAMPQIAGGIKSVLGALAEGISAVARAFRKEDRVS